MDNQEHAEMIYKNNKEKYFKEINNSIVNTKIYNEGMLFPIRIMGGGKQEIELQYADTVSALAQAVKENPNSKVAALNFASYKHPGGMFMNGAMAQEEALCHCSTLYNVLESFDNTYYANNRKELNKAFYLNRALYTPDIIFYNDENTYQFNADIITCAAPNVKPIIRYRIAPREDIFRVMYDRIDFILNIAQCNAVDILILGAFGCGVFGNKASDVAYIFNDLLTNKYNHSFNKVIFAIPGGSNYYAFRKEFCDTIIDDEMPMVEDNYTGKEVNNNGNIK